MVIYLPVLFFFSVFPVFLSKRGPGKNSIFSLHFLLPAALCSLFLLAYSYGFLSHFSLGLRATLTKLLPSNTDDLYFFSLWSLGASALSSLLGLGLFMVQRKKPDFSLFCLSSQQRNALGCVFTVIPLLFVGAFCLNSYGKSSILISEVCAKNYAFHVDKLGYYSDYVELYNPLPFPVGTRGLYLTDDLESDPMPLGELSAIPAHGYALAWTDYSIYQFGLSKQGDSVYLLSRQKEVLDSVTIPALDSDTVYARNGDTLAWEVHAPSPMAPAGRQEKPAISLTFSAEAGFYDAPFSLVITAPENCRIYYTLDSSIPDTSSALYTGPIWVENVCSKPNVYRAVQNIVEDWKNHVPTTETVDKAFVVRAIAIDDQGHESKVYTKSYFVDMDDYRQGYVLSLVSDPGSLFGDEGIYVTGKAYDDWYTGGQEGEAPIPSFCLKTEVEASAELFQNDLLMSQDVGLRIQGASARYSPYKRLSVFSRPLYSNSRYFSYDLFQKNTHSFFTRSGVADVVANQLISGTSLGGLDNLQADVFLDGEFWYTMYLRERYDKAYIAETFHVQEDRVEIAEEMPEEIYEFIASHPLDSDENYDALNEIMDIQNYIEFLSANLYLCNLDTSELKNLRLWRADGYSGLDPEDGRWRFLVYDTDALSWDGYNFFGMELYKINAFSERRPWPYPVDSYDLDTVFMAIRKNPRFCRDFVLTFMDLANTCFEKERAARVLAQYGEDRTWNHGFFDNRFDYAAADLAEEFSLRGTLETISLQTEQPHMGTLRINSVTPELDQGSWSGRYYTDYPVTITAEPAYGYQFVAWHNGSQVYTDPTLEVQLVEGENLWQAQFQKTAP